MSAVKDLATQRNKIHPKKFALYVAFVSIMMMFAGLTSAYIVRQAAGNWLEFRLPNMFYVSTLIILTSSATLHFAYQGFLNGNEKIYKGLLLVSLVLGFTFMVTQYLGWQQLTAIGVDLKGNPAGSFVYVLSGIHVIHVLGGVAAILMAVIHAFTLDYKVTPVRKLRFELTNQYWHFVDLLWVYLLLFMLLQR
jgi:cytochrome c oxidase subunit III